MSRFYDDGHEEGDGGNEVDYAGAFVKAGFVEGKEGRLTWKGLPYPEVQIEFLPDGWGRPQADVWVTASYIAEPYEGVHGFKSKVFVDVTLSSRADAVFTAREWASRARADAAKMKKVVPGVLVIGPKGVRRMVTGVWRFKNGAPDAAPLVLEGLKKRFAYCQVELA